jgi:hypothetical protein
MNDATAEERIRHALAAAAETIDTAAFAEPSLHGTGSRVSPRWHSTWIVAAVLVVVIVIGGAVAISLREGDGTQAAVQPGWDPNTSTCTPTLPDGSDGFFGSPTLAVLLPVNGATGITEAEPVDDGYYVKMGWRRPAGSRLTIDVLQLDSAGLGWAEVPDGYPGSMQATGIITNEPGCFQVTGHADGESLSFVSHIQPASS